MAEVFLVFVDEGGVIKESFGHLFGHTAANFPGGRGEIAAKGEATRNIKDVGDNEAEGACHIRVMLQLTKTRLYITGK